MIKIKPIMTEKSMNMAKVGKYSFWVSRDLNKKQIKALISKIFGVTVLSVRTINYKKFEKNSSVRKSKTVKPARKKAIVVLDPKDKIALFGEEEKKSKKKKAKKK